MKLADPTEISDSRALRGIGTTLALYFWITWRAWLFDLSPTARGLESGLYLPWFFCQSLGWTIHWMPVELHRLLLSGLALLSLITALAFQTSSNCRWPQRILAGLLACKLFFYFHSLRQVANFHHMHLLFTAVFLFARPRIQWLRMYLAVVYWLAASVKFTPSWLYGEYFNSLPCKLPLLPSSAVFVTWACNLVTTLELLAPLAFWSQSQFVRRLAVVALLGFHLYSGFIVGIWYTSLMVPFVACLFADGFSQPLPSLRKLLAGKAGAALFALIVVGSWSWIIPGDVRFTAEGRYLGLFMFDANHRARAEIGFERELAHWRVQVTWPWPDANFSQACRTRIWREGVEIKQKPSWFEPTYFTTLSARILNDPYVYYHWLQQQGIQKASLQLFSQLDGHPEEVCTVDEAEFSASMMKYQGWWRNSWIHLPRPDAPPSYRWF